MTVMKGAAARPWLPRCLEPACGAGREEAPLLDVAHCWARRNGAVAGGELGVRGPLLQLPPQTSFRVCTG